MILPAEPLRHLVVALLVGATSVLVAGCAGSAGPSNDAILMQAGLQPAQSRADRALSRLAHGQLDQPDPQASDFVGPLGRIAQALSLLEPGSEPFRRASLTLDEAIDDLLGSPDARTTEDSHDAHSPNHPPLDSEAIRVYIAGRTALLQGDLPRAIELLQAASVLAEQEPRVWRELGEAQRAAGDGRAALDSLLRAIDLGIDQPGPMLFAALESRLQGQPAKDAATLLARAMRLHPGRADPGLAHLVELHLGSSLLELGYLAAGGEALRAGLTLPGSFTVRTRFSDELGKALRQQATLWIRMGDAMARLGQPEQAWDQYRRALRSARPGTEPIPTRRVLILMRLGRSAQAVRVLARTLDTPIAVRDERLVHLTRAVAQLESVQPLLNDRLDELGAERDASSPAIAAWWTRVRAAASTRDRAARLLQSAIERDPTRYELIVDLLTLETNDAARADRALELVGGHPLGTSILAAALTATSRHPAAILAHLRDRDSDAARLLTGELMLLGGDPLGAGRALARWSQGDDLEPARTVAQLSASAAMGDWEHAEQLLQTIDERAPYGALARAVALRAMQRFDESIRTLEAIPEPTISHLHMLGDTARLAGRITIARSTFKALHDRDPFDESAYEGLLGLPSPPDEDPSSARTLFDQLRKQMPGARVTRRIEAQQLTARGELARAEQAHAELADELPDPGQGVEPLLGVWESLANRTGPAALQRGLTWVRTRQETHPASAGLMRAEVVLLVDLRRSAEALQRIEHHLTSSPASSLQQLREHLIRSSLRETQRANRLTIDRLTGRGRSVSETIELAGILAQTSQLDRAVRELQRGLPGFVQLTESQRQNLGAIVSLAARQAAANPSGPAREQALTLIALSLDRQVELALPMIRLYLGLLTTGETVDARALGRAVSQARSTFPEQARALTLLPIRALASAGRVDEALDLMNHLSATTSFDDPQSALVWAALIAQGGTAPDVQLMLAHITDSQTLRTLIAPTTPGDDSTDTAPDDPRSLAQLRAEVAYRLAGAIGSRLGRDAAMGVLEVVLELDDQHALALNDLGYYFAESGEQLDRAEQLTHHAVDLLPDQGNVLDSLAWVRYRMGVLDDVPATDDSPARAGAVSLLIRAVAMDQSDLPSPTLLDHLGDALWASGRHDEAKSAWNRAARAARDRVEALRAQGLPEQALASTIEETVLIEAKLEAVDTGQPPQITPIVGVCGAIPHPDP